jgi:three-Cys-motif partner protein
LERYLTDMAFKVAQGRGEVLTAINYVDGFSGPWNTQDETGYSDTSFRRAIQALRIVRSEIQRVRHAKLLVRFVFCEESRARHAKLLEAVSLDNDVEVHCIHGRFEQKLAEVSAVCRDGFTFSFIDPTGFKLHTQAIAHFLRSQRGEFLWNYMADHANRFLTRRGLEDAYGALLAEEKWGNRVNEPDLCGLSNEQRILAVLRERLKDLGCAQFVIDFPVMRPRENRVQFRLLFGTRKAAGVTVFRAIQKKAETFQAKRREELRQEDSGTMLVSPEMHATSFLAREGIDGSKAKQAAPGRVLSYLRENGATRFRELLAPILETEGLTETGLKDVLLQMRANGLILYKLPPGARKPLGDVAISLG